MLGLNPFFTVSTNRCRRSHKEQFFSRSMNMCVNTRYNSLLEAWKRWDPQVQWEADYTSYEMQLELLCYSDFDVWAPLSCQCVLLTLVHTHHCSHTVSQRLERYSRYWISHHYSNLGYHPEFHLEPPSIGRCGKIPRYKIGDCGYKQYNAVFLHQMLVVHFHEELRHEKFARHCGRSVAPTHSNIWEKWGLSQTREVKAYNKRVADAQYEDELPGVAQRVGYTFI